ncbi:MAG: FG-GAP repeat domain-containing protein [Phycisphaerales bacterium]
MLHRFTAPRLRGAVAAAAASAGAAGFLVAPAAGQTFDTFGAGADFGLLGPPIAIATGDLDGDGDQDFVGVSGGAFGGSLTAFFNDGTGGFKPGSSPTSISSSVVAIVLADFDGDGTLDLAEADAGPDRIRVRLGDGDGTFGGTFASINVGANPVDMVAADADGDGDLDLITANGGGCSLTVVRRGPGGSFTANAPVSTPCGVVDLAAGDLDGDGDADFVVAVPSSNLVAVYESIGSGGLASAGTLACPGEPVAVGIGQFAGAARGDIVAATGAGQQVHVWESVSSAPSFGPPVIRNSGVEARALVVGDLDNDNDSDVVLIGDGPGDSSTRARALVTVAGPLDTVKGFDETNAGIALALADIDGNGSNDLVSLIADEPLRLVRARINRTDVVPPGSFAIAFPMDGTTGLPRPQDLQWEGAAARVRWTPAAGFTVRYRLRIANDPELTDLVVDVDGINGLTYTVPPGELGDGFSFWWSVTASSQGGATIVAPAVARFDLTCREDLDGSGAIDFSDLLEILTRWGEVCSG